MYNLSDEQIEMLQTRMEKRISDTYPGTSLTNEDIRNYALTALWTLCEALKELRDLQDLNV